MRPTRPTLRALDSAGPRSTAHPSGKPPGRRAASIAVAVVALLVLAPAVLAGPPAPGCAPADGNGCEMRSDVLVFAEGDPTWEVTAYVTSCEWCSAPDPTDGKFDIKGTAEVTFGPYYPGHPCTFGSDTLTFTLGGFLIEGAGTPGGDPTYVPYDSAQEFDAHGAEDLHTSCVDAAWLDYAVPWVTLTGLDGAATHELASNYHASLILPESVRSTEGSRVPLDTFRLTQGMDFTHTTTHDSSSTFRYWPEGLPLRLGPHSLTYVPAEVTFDTPGPPSGPPAYEPAPPETSNLDPVQIIDCQDPESPGNPCSWQVWNAGYLDHASWLPSATRFDLDGMDLDLDLPPGERVLYEPLFPQGTWLELSGPAALDVRNSRVVEGGSFDGGTAWLKTRYRGACLDDIHEMRFALNESSMQPRVTPDGGIVAGIEDLNRDGPFLQRVEWTFNSSRDLGCGTLWVPPPLNDVHDANNHVVGPQREWIRSAESTDAPATFTDPVNGRGVYAGFNYNRNRVCVDAGGTLGDFCATETDCPTGWTCEHDRWSPLCPTQDLSTSPRWTTAFQKPDPAPPGWTPLVFEIEPTDGDEEMAFYTRASGVTGVFDAGTESFTLGDTSDDQFTLQFNSFGHAFLASHAEWSDTVIRGGLLLDWPSQTSVPFNDMGMCDCGSARSASAGEPPTENKLLYWDAPFKPFGLRFSQDTADQANCVSTSGTACQQDGTGAKSVCIDADTPIPHFAPEPTSAFAVAPDGNPGAITPLSGPQFDFEPNDYVPPYDYHAEAFALNDWVAAGSPSYAAVIDLEVAPFGYYDAEGQLSMPYFGLPDSGVLVQREDADYETHRVDLHERGFPNDPHRSYVPVEREIAGDTVPMSYRVDYFRPSRTADPGDGDDLNGRGLLLGYSWSGPSAIPANDPNLNLGSIQLPAVLVMTPGTILSDLGPFGMTRLWGATTGLGRVQLENIVPPSHLDHGGTYDTVLTLFPEYDPWNLPGIDNLFIDELYARGAADVLAVHPDATRLYNTSPLDPGINATRLLGYLTFSPGLDMVDLAYVDANLDTGGQFFAFDRSNLTVDRHVKQNSQEQPITQMGRNEEPNDMALPGEMSVPFPDVPGMQWDFEYDVGLNPPSFEFVSLTGSLDLTQGGLSNVGFDRAGMTLKFWSDGDWYFDAGLGLSFNGWSAYGDILLGNTKDLTPLQALDPVVADFLGGIPSFQGGYVRVGASGRIFDLGCLFNIGVGFEVGGWYINDGFGIKFRGFLTGEAVCLLSIRGDITILGGEVGDKFKMQGTMWVAGGIGFCDADSWDTPADVLDDDFCLSCVLSGSVTGVSPPKLKLSMDGPDVECSL